MVIFFLLASLMYWPLQNYMHLMIPIIYNIFDSGSDICNKQLMSSNVCSPCWKHSIVILLHTLIGNLTGLRCTFAHEFWLVLSQYCIRMESAHVSWVVLVFFGVLLLLCYGAVFLFEHNILCSVIYSKCTRVSVYFTLTVFICATGLCVHKWKSWS